MKGSISLSLIVGLAACHTYPRTGSEPATRTLGTFAYHVNITGQREETGTFTISRDTVMVEADEEICRRVPELSISERSHVFDCGGAFGLKALSLTIDSKQPLLSRWYAIRTESRSRRVCSLQVVTPEGRQYCAQYRTETYDADIPFGGPLRVSVAAADPSL